MKGVGIEMEIYLAILAGLGEMFGWGLADFFAKKSVDKLGAIKTLFWSQTIGMLPIVILLLVSKESPNLNMNILLLLLAFAAGDYVGYLLFYKGLEKGLVSILGPVFATQSGIAVLISAFLFGESISQMRWVGLAIAFIGIILVSLQPVDGKISLKNVSKGLPEVLVATILFGFFFPCWDWFLGYQGEGWIIPTTIQRILFVVILLSTIIVIGFKKRGSTGIIVKGKKLWLWLALIGLLDAIAALAMTWGYKFTTVTSVVIILMGAAPLPTVILARIFLKEKITKSQILGIAAIIIGTIILVLK